MVESHRVYWRCCEASGVLKLYPLLEVGKPIASVHDSTIWPSTIVHYVAT